MATKHLLPLGTLSRLERRLISAARKAVRSAYCPYSNFSVGAAVLTESGNIYTGCNVENCSYGASICAERVAIFKAVSEGHTKFKAIAIYAPEAPKHAVSCGCGICRQVIAEFGLDILILKLCNDGMVVRKPIRLLLPNSFVPAIVGHAKTTRKETKMKAKPRGHIDRVVAAVTENLTPDLLQPRYRKLAAGKHPTFGHCYAASEAVWYLLGGKESDYTPNVVRVPGGTHWYLKHKTKESVYLDPTAEQFAEPVPYENGVRCPFLTGKPSKRAAALIERATKQLSQSRRKRRT